MLRYLGRTSQSLTPHARLLAAFEALAAKQPAAAKNLLEHLQHAYLLDEWTDGYYAVVADKVDDLVTASWHGRWVRWSELVRAILGSRLGHHARGEADTGDRIQLQDLERELEDAGHPLAGPHFRQQDEVSTHVSRSVACALTDLPRATTGGALYA